MASVRLARLDDRRGSHRPGRGHHRGLDRPDRLGAGQRGRRACQHHRGLAVHRGTHDVRIGRGRAQRCVAVSFWRLAPYIAIQAVRDLATHHPATTSVLGIALTTSSVVIMPALGITKQRLGRRLNSGATTGEGIQNLMCAAQAAAVLFGLAVVAIWPAGWPVDPVIALGIAAWSAWEGRQAGVSERLCK
jgi:hypothetical protein